MAQTHWEHFAHEADVGIRGFGRSPAEAFEQAALAMTAAITDPATVTPTEEVAIACAAPDLEMLLTDWLNALIYEMATRHMLFGRFAVEIADGRLEGRAWGEPLSIGKHAPSVELKGATYTSLRVAEERDGLWSAECVVDV